MNSGPTTPSPPAASWLGVEVVLVTRTIEVSLGKVETSPSGALSLLDDLFHLQMALRRFGWSLQLEQVSPRLEELLELTGLRGQL